STSPESAASMRAWSTRATPARPSKPGGVAPAAKAQARSRADRQARRCGMAISRWRTMPAIRPRAPPGCNAPGSGSDQRHAVGAVDLHQQFAAADLGVQQQARRSEEHTSELQSRENLVCRLLLEKIKNSRRVGQT